MGSDVFIQKEESILLTKDEFEEFLVIDGLSVEKTRYSYIYNGKGMEIYRAWF